MYRALLLWCTAVLGLLLMPVNVAAVVATIAPMCYCIFCFTVIAPLSPRLLTAASSPRPPRFLRLALLAITYGGTRGSRLGMFCFKR